MSRPSSVSPTRDDPFVRAGSEGVGGPGGRRVRPGTGWWTPARVLLAATVTTCWLATVGGFARGYCRANSFSSDGGRDYIHLCYSDLPHVYRDLGLPGTAPYVDYRGTEPVLTDSLLRLVARITGADRPTLYFEVSAFVLTAFAALAVWAVLRTAAGRPWDAAAVAFAPVLLLSATINWDLAAVALASVALLAWARHRPVATGALLGVACAVKPYPVLLLVALLLVCLRAGRLAFWARATVAAGLTWLALNLPLLLIARSEWWDYFTAPGDRGAGLGTVWLALDQRGLGVPDDRVRALALLTFLLLLIAITVLVLTASRRPRLPQVALLVVAAYVLSAPSYSPQHALWLLPLAALARPRWRDLLVWQAGEAVYYVLVFLHLAGALAPSRPGGLDSAYWWGIFVHLAATGYLAGVVVRDVLHPEHDPVRDDGSDDPAGGVLDEAPDAIGVGVA